MTTNETIKLLQKLRGAYGSRFEVTEYTAYAWHDYLKNKSYEEIKEKLNNHITSKKYPPTIGHLLI